MITISEITDLSRFDLTEMITESKLEGHRHIQKLADHYASGENRFDQPGEVLLGAFDQNQLVGICGLNREPFSAQGNLGRVRRMYILKGYRRLGLGKRMIHEVLHRAEGEFDELVLRAGTKAAGMFYLALGFKETDTYEQVTHSLIINNKKE